METKYGLGMLGGLFFIATLIFTESPKQGLDVSKSADGDPNRHAGEKGDRSEKEVCPKCLPHIRLDGVEG